MNREYTLVHSLFLGRIIKCTCNGVRRSQCSNCTHFNWRCNKKDCKYCHDEGELTEIDVSTKYGLK